MISKVARADVVARGARPRLSFLPLQSRRLLPLSQGFVQLGLCVSVEWVCGVWCVGVCGWGNGESRAEQCMAQSPVRRVRRPSGPSSKQVLYNKQQNEQRYNYHMNAFFLSFFRTTRFAPMHIECSALLVHRPHMKYKLTHTHSHTHTHVLPTPSTHPKYTSKSPLLF